MKKIISTSVAVLAFLSLSFGGAFAATSHPFTSADASLVPAQCSSMTFATVIIGTNGNDAIRGTNSNDLILGLGGNDSISGGNGSDCILGGDGNDSIAGEAGNDVLLGGNGNDIMSGGLGNDNLVGGAGYDIVSGAQGTNQCDAEVMGWGCPVHASN